MAGARILEPRLFSLLPYARNLALSFAAGNATVWKPSPSTPLCSIAVTKIVSGVLERNGIPGAAASLVIGGKDVGEAVVENESVDMGKGYPLWWINAFSRVLCSVFHWQ